MTERCQKKVQWKKVCFYICVKGGFNLFALIPYAFFSPFRLLESRVKRLEYCELTGTVDAAKD